MSTKLFTKTAAPVTFVARELTRQARAVAQGRDGGLPSLDAQGASRSGFTLIEVLVIITVLCVLVLLVIPMFQRTRARSELGICVNQVKQIGLCFRLWAGDNGGAFPMQISVADGGTLEMVSGGSAAVQFSVLSNCLSFPTLVWCPQDADRTRAADFSPPFGNSNVSYFVNLGATASLTNVVLAGDHKIMVDGVPTTSGSLSLYRSNTVGWTRGLHAGKGNIVFSDGHAEQGGSEVLESALTRGDTPIRLAIP